MRVQQTIRIRTRQPLIKGNIVDSLGSLDGMFASRSIASKCSGIVALTLAIFSAGFVVVHACHSDQLKQSTLASSFEFTDKTLSTIVGGSSFAANICTAVFLLALLTIRKFVIKANTKVFEQTKLHILRLRSVTQRPPNFVSALSQFQLGVIRI